ncbi:hypothetical protein [Streptomyces sp. NPDC090025]|uniref:hypothetical protein n=1 Tax=Streptomyces sp. NPDC090025 TaxID=3365922 RepID=UPI0038360B2D
MTWTPFTQLDRTGLTPQEAGTWTDGQGLLLSIHYFDLVPDLPAALDEPERLREGLAHSAAHAGGGLIEAEVAEVGGMPGLRQLIKVPLERGHGQAFVGSWTVPRDRSSAVVKVQAAEGRRTGLREALIVDEVGPMHFFTPHPYAPEVTGGLPHHAADDERWDARFPDHPLTRVRATLRRITPSIAFADEYRERPPFAAPATTA